MGTFFLGIDLGTSAVKVSLIDEHGQLTTSSAAEYPMLHPNPGWVEQKPSDWWGAVCKAIQQLFSEQSSLSPGEIAAVGLSGQMHSLVLLDSAGEVLRNAIIWADQRTSIQCAEIAQLLGELLVDVAYNPATTGFTAPKLLWVKQHEPELFRKVRHILLPKDFIRYKLTGKIATDYSDASATLLFDVKNRRWSNEITRKLGIDHKILPPILSPIDVAGEVSEEAALQTGLRKGTPVITGAGDTEAAAVGNGCTVSGVASVSLGTAAQVFITTESPVRDPKLRIHSLCHAVPDKWHVMGAIQNAGIALRWFAEEFAAAETSVSKALRTSAYELINQEVEKTEPGAQGLIFLPYLTGERSPHMDPDARGVFFGINLTHTRAHFARAIMEGVSFALRDCIDVLDELGIEITQFRLSGGGASSAVWRQIQADIYGHPVVVTDVTDASSRGAAVLAAVGVGHFSSFKEANSSIKMRIVQEPILGNVQMYQQQFKLFQDLYRDLKADFEKLGSFKRVHIRAANSG